MDIVVKFNNASQKYHIAPLTKSNSIPFICFAKPSISDLNRAISRLTWLISFSNLFRSSKLVDSTPVIGVEYEVQSYCYCYLINGSIRMHLLFYFFAITSWFFWAFMLIKSVFFCYCSLLVALVFFRSYFSPFPLIPCVAQLLVWSDLDPRRDSFFYFIY
jgi:sensor histidine kinase YesM